MQALAPVLGEKRYLKVMAWKSLVQNYVLQRRAVQMR